MRYQILEDDAEDRAEGVRSSTEDFKPNCRDKTVNLAHLIEEKTNKKEFFWSYELFPTSSLNAYPRFLEETQICAPAFYALTWHEESGITLNERFPALKSIEALPQNTLLHCTGKGLKRLELEQILSRALELGIMNIFALHGDAGAEGGDFSHALDVVKFIRERFGNLFSVCVAGYPEVHPQSLSKDLDLQHLKEKIDAGADFIITQLFFESHVFIQFVENCRKIGISVPIIPGIYPFTNIKLLNKMISICRSNVPPKIQEQLEQIKDDDEVVEKLGIKLSVDIIRDIRKSGYCYGYHLFTLNRSYSAVEIARQLNSDQDEYNT